MTFGEKMKALMDERGITLGQLARDIPCNKGHLSNIWNDRRRPSERIAELLDQHLGANGELVALVPPPRRPPVVEPSPSLALFDHPAVNGRPADAAYVETVRETSQALVRLDTLHGGNDVFPMALRAFREAGHKLGTGAYASKVERDLLAAAGEAGEVAAWLAYDADRQDVSRQIIHEALLLTRQAGDRDMELFELAHLAMQSLYLYRPAEALRITTAVLDDGDLPPRVAALFDIRRGRALAQLGDRPRALHALDRARSAIADGISPRDPHWTWWIDDAEVMWHQATARAELGAWAEAEPLLIEVAERRAGYRRARYNDLGHLLNVLVHVQAWREAEQVMAELAATVGEVGSTRTTNLLRRVCDRIGQAMDAPSTVTDAAAALRSSTR